MRHWCYGQFQLRIAGHFIVGRVALRAVLQDQLSKCLACFVSDPRHYTLHSFRAGGATFAANFTTVTKDQLKRHGHWVSDAVDSYIEPSLESRLCITKQMNAY
jgi:hypothetical protein